MNKFDQNVSQKLVSFVFIALMLGSIFTSVVSADVDNVNGSSLINESFDEWASKPVIELISKLSIKSSGMPN